MAGLDVIASDRRERGNLIGKIVVANVAWQSQHVYFMGLPRHSVPRNDKDNRKRSLRHPVTLGQRQLISLNGQTEKRSRRIIQSVQKHLQHEFRRKRRRNLSLCSLKY